MRGFSMNRITTGVVVAAALSLVTIGAARGQGGTASVEDQLKKMEKDRAAAVVKADVATLEKLTSDDYILINANGQLSDKATTMNNIKTGNIKLTANEVSDLKVRVYGDTAGGCSERNANGTNRRRAIKGTRTLPPVALQKDGPMQS